jgi:hypothetical protein
MDMPRHVQEVSTPALVLQRGDEDKDDWFYAEQAIRRLQEEFGVEVHDGIQKVYVDGELAARKYSHGGKTRINFFKGFFPKKFEDFTSEYV